MSAPTLNLFPARVPIGRVTLPDGSEADVLMTPEFFRSLSLVFVRLGGASAMSNEELEQMALQAMTPAADDVARAGIAALELVAPLDQSAQISALTQRIDELMTLCAAVPSLSAEVAALRRGAGDVEHLALHRDPFRVDWERPGKIGALTAATGAFTTLAATTVNKLTLTAPASAATLTIADGKTLTISNTLTLMATDGSTLTIGTGGTLGSAAYSNTTDFAARAGTALAPVATDPASTQTLANSMRSVLLAVGIGS